MKMRLLVMMTPILVLGACVTPGAPGSSTGAGASPFNPQLVSELMQVGCAYSVPVEEIAALYARVPTKLATNAQAANILCTAVLNPPTLPTTKSPTVAVPVSGVVIHATAQ